MARAYAYAMERGPRPYELDLFLAVETLGSAAVYGSRMLSGREIKMLMVARSAQTVVAWCKQREASGNWAEWEKTHTHEARALALVHEESLEL